MTCITLCDQCVVTTPSRRHYTLSDSDSWPEDDNSSVSPPLFAPPTRKVTWLDSCALSLHVMSVHSNKSHNSYISALPSYKSAFSISYCWVNLSKTMSAHNLVDCFDLLAYFNLLDCQNHADWLSQVDCI